VTAGWPDASRAPATTPLRQQIPTMPLKKFATYDSSSLEKQLTYSKSMLNRTSFTRNIKTSKETTP